MLNKLPQRVCVGGGGGGVWGGGGGGGLRWLGWVGAVWCGAERVDESKKKINR